MTVRTWCVVAVIALLAFPGPAFGQPPSVTVNDAGDVLHDAGCAATGSGTCTLRDAITYLNAIRGGRISFSVDNQAIRPTSALPPVTASVSIAGPLSILVPTSQEIDGSLAGAADGLVIDADVCTLYGVSVRNFRGSGLVIRGGGNVVGGALDCGGLRCFDHITTVSNNGGHGIEILAGSNLVRHAGVAGNGGNGIYLHGGAQGNQIGTDELGPAVYWYPPNSIGGNGGAGIRVGDPGDASTRSNSILANTISDDPAIDLGGDGPTPNDEGDVDDGPNALQNFPVVCSAALNPADGAALVSGLATGPPNAFLTLRFFTSPPGRASQAGAFLGSTTVPLDAGGRAFFEASLSPPIARPWPDPLGRVVATATDPEGNTSELGRLEEAPAPAQGLSFHTLPPCRLVDTRSPGDAPLKSPRGLRLRGGCGVPATARAVAANVTVTNATSPGHLSLAATTCPPPTSTLNFSAGQTRANSAALALDGYGRMTAWPVVAAGSSLDLILDVTGYWE